MTWKITKQRQALFISCFFLSDSDESSCVVQVLAWGNVLTQTAYFSTTVTLTVFTCVAWRPADPALFLLVISHGWDTSSIYTLVAHLWNNMIINLVKEISNPLALPSGWPFQMSPFENLAGAVLQDVFCFWWKTKTASRAKHNPPDNKLLKSVHRYAFCWASPLALTSASGHYKAASTKAFVQPAGFQSKGCSHAALLQAPPPRDSKRHSQGIQRGRTQKPAKTSTQRAHQHTSQACGTYFAACSGVGQALFQATQLSGVVKVMRSGLRFKSTDWCKNI